MKKSLLNFLKDNPSGFAWASILLPCLPSLVLAAAMGLRSPDDLGVPMVSGFLLFTLFSGLLMMLMGMLTLLHNRAQHRVYHAVWPVAGWLLSCSPSVFNHLSTPLVLALAAVAFFAFTLLYTAGLHNIVWLPPAEHPNVSEETPNTAQEV